MSSKLKFFYFDIKNIYSEDGKYLKHYSENGLWIKDEIDDEIYIINASANNKEKFLKDVFINKFDKNFNLVEVISSNKADISANDWVIEKPVIFRILPLGIGNFQPPPIVARIKIEAFIMYNLIHQAQTYFSSVFEI